jgi:hypothetical protein
MGRGWPRIAVMVALVATIAACDRNRVPELMNVRPQGQGPDEFGIVPNKPLQAPEDFSALPTPTPGGSNLVDPTPEDDAIAALGGNPAVVARGASAGDAGLISHASRFGVGQDIRQVLAQEDVDFRRRRDGRLLERMFSVNIYYRAYEPQSLNKYSELERLRAAGVKTPSAPPAARD